MFNKEKVKINLGDKTISLMVIKDIDILLADVCEEEEIPFWAELWPSAIALAKYLWKLDDLEGQHILELGAGTGLPGIAAALKGAAVTQTDFVQEALEIACQNAVMNDVEIRFQQEDWRQFGIDEKFDLIIGSDILYEPKMHVYIKKILTKNLENTGQIFIADPNRMAATEFIDNFIRDGWQVDKYIYEINQKTLFYKVIIYSLQPPAEQELAKGSPKYNSKN